MKKLLPIFVLLAAWTTSAFASSGSVTVTAPKNNSTVAQTIQYVATAWTSCSKGVSAMGIYTAPGQLVYTVGGASLNTLITLNPGTYTTTVEEWDNCGGAATTNITITVGSGGGGGGSTFYNLQGSGGWTGYALGPPSYQICNNCPGIQYSMTQGVKSPSLSGNATMFWIGGSTQYGDVLWNNHLIGDYSSQGLPDYNHTLVPTLHNFTYDVYFYGSNLNLSQALEFDINQFVNGQGFIWGHECRIAGGNEWDTWDNINQKWVPTGVGCWPNNNSWNHLTIKVQRTSSNQLLFESVTLNGVTNNWNITRSPGSAPGWYGVTINYQMDGNKYMNGYTDYLDQLNFSYW